MKTPKKHRVTEGVEEKRCTVCGEWRALAEYYTSGTTWDGLESRCAFCMREKAKKWYNNNKERAIANRTAWRKEHRDKDNAHAREYAHKNFDRLRGTKRSYQLLRDYGLSTEEYAEMFSSQSGRCAICGCVQNGKALAVDHDHLTGKVRGLLCSSCNLILGNASDNPELLRAAAGYLETHGR